MTTTQGASSSPAVAQHDVDLHSMMNLSFLDPPRFGWAAVGGTIDLLTPHEKARRGTTREEYLEALSRKEKERREASFPKNNDSISITAQYQKVTASIESLAARAAGQQHQSPLAQSPGLSSPTRAGPSLKLTLSPGMKVRDDNARLKHTFGSSEAILARVGGPESNIDELADKKAAAKELEEQQSSDDAADDDEPEAKSTTTTTTAKNNNKKRKKKTMQVHALDESGVLDIYTYHRGREGSEPRCKETGCLLCEEQKIDTNHEWEPPKLSTTVTVCFPLGSVESPASSDAPADIQKGNGGSEMAQYREIIEWDLSDPATQTPLAFATNVAEDFGLSFAQTLDLAASIQQQIDDFVQRRVSYAPPITLKDPHDVDRPPRSLTSHVLGGPVQLYGGVNSDIPGGVQILRDDRADAAAPSVDLTGEESADDRASSKRKSLPGVEQKYRVEVRKRAVLGSMDELKSLAIDRGEALNGMMIQESDLHCHLCKSRKEEGARFACGVATHALCSEHLEERYGIELPEGGEAPVVHEYCPFCSLSCDCGKCSRKLDSIAVQLKEKAEEQKATPEGTIFDEAFALCKKASLGSKKHTAKLERRRSAVRVPKISASEFPREVSGGLDLDPGTAEDYRSVYTKDGIFVRTDLGDGSAASPAPPGGIAEDGNVDYCNVCKKIGNLLCCDRCPRAFHQECITSNNKASGDESLWECRECQKERTGVPDDLVNGDSSLGLILSAAKELQQSPGLLESLRVLAIIHEAVKKLIWYDFGPIFQAPVDCTVVRGYDKIIKNPMDLGTIATKLEDGSYIQLYHANKSWDDVIAAALKDIALVWHNCFTFNFEGSSVFRMAEVQRRKFGNIRKSSFDHLISDAVKDQVKTYVQECEQERKKIVPTSNIAASPGHRAQGKHKITVPVTMNRTARSVAVLDPDTGLLVKIYNTIKTACTAAAFLANLGHEVEYTPFGEGTLRTLLRKSHAEPDSLLFGYRWLYLDDLQGRKVRYAGEENMDAQEDDEFQPPPGLVQMKDGDCSYIFVSIDEALCFPDLPKEVPLYEIRKRLSECPIGEWRSIVGRSWKRLLPPAHMQAPTQSESDLVNGSVARVAHPFPSDVTIVKEDLISKCILQGFNSSEAAHRDWMRAREGSIAILPQEKEDLEYFKTYYLEGPRNVNGIVWRALPPRTGENENVANTSEGGIAPSMKLDGAKDLQVDVVDGRAQLVPKQDIVNEKGGLGITQGTTNGETATFASSEGQKEAAAAGGESAEEKSSRLTSLEMALANNNSLDMAADDDASSEGEPGQLVLNGSVVASPAKTPARRSKRAREGETSIAAEAKQIAKKKAINV